MTPYGAGLTDESNQNFNINWQNQQLQRQLAGLSGIQQANAGAGQLGQGASQQYTGSQAMSALAPQLMSQSAMAPLSAYQQLFNMGTGIDQTDLGLQQQMFSPNSTMMQQMLNYMGLGAGVGQANFQDNQAQLANTIGLAGLGTNSFGMGPGGGWGPLGSLFNNVGGWLTGLGGGGAGTIPDFTASAEFAAL
jgi:hypothetical protein